MRMNIGDRFGMLTVVELIPHSKNPKAVCRCDCGGSATAIRGNLRSGHTSSCGCMRTRPRSDRPHTHKTPRAMAYQRWSSMLDRCRNSNACAYNSYGGRGIRVEWTSFEEFYSDMGDAPSGYWLERIDNDGNYSKSNCEWTTAQTNSLNKRTSRWWIIDGVTYASSTEAGKAHGVSRGAINHWCRGTSHKGKTYPPKSGCSSYLKYEEGPNQ